MFYLLVMFLIGANFRFTFRLQGYQKSRQFYRAFLRRSIWRRKGGFFKSSDISSSIDLLSPLMWCTWSCILFGSGSGCQYYDFTILHKFNSPCVNLPNMYSESWIIQGLLILCKSTLGSGNSQ
ncbi:hypothetical protein NC651_017240 [Populus alba x Populus x berolinensis]|nr:hypothetical protein NC651_017240 [Populus alba x Populus x berolinensis]